MCNLCLNKMEEYVNFIDCDIKFIYEQIPKLIEQIINNRKCNCRYRINGKLVYNGILVVQCIYTKNGEWTGKKDIKKIEYLNIFF